MHRGKSSRYRALLMLIASIVFAAASQQVVAACTATAGTTPAVIDYGTYASEDVPAGGISLNGTGVDATFSVTCSITLSLQLLSTTSWLRYTAQSALTMSNGTDSISYSIGSNSTFTPAITASGQSIGGPTGFTLLALALLSGIKIDIPLHTTTSTTAVWPNAGTYTGTQTLVVDGSMCTGLGLPGVCLGSTPITGTVAMSFKMIVSKSCEFISTPTLVDFGSVSFLENANTVLLNTVLRCTHLEDYLLYADNGDHYSNGSRQMTASNGYSIKYDILQPGSTTLLLSSATPLSNFGTGTNETFAIPIRIATGQTTPPAATYSDNVRMVIEY